MGSNKLITLDTHTLIWWLSHKRKLSSVAERRIDSESRTERNINVSSISIWEISLLIAQRRLIMNVDLEDWIRQLESIDAIQFIPVDNRIAMRSTLLPEPLHKDPADRIIIATARDTNSPLVTADEKIRRYAHVETIW